MLRELQTSAKQSAAVRQETDVSLVNWRNGARAFFQQVESGASRACPVRQLWVEGACTCADALAGMPMMIGP